MWESRRQGAPTKIDYDLNLKAKLTYDSPWWSFYDSSCLVVSIGFREETSQQSADDTIQASGLTSFTI